MRTGSGLLLDQTGRLSVDGWADHVVDTSDAGEPVRPGEGRREPRNAQVDGVDRSDLSSPLRMKTDQSSVDATN
jgi:hypothetical protein